MNLVLKTFTTTFIAMLVLVGAAFFVLPLQNEAQAQGGATRSFCFNSSNGTFPKTVNGFCPTGSEPKAAPGSFGGFCVFPLDGVYEAGVPNDGISLDKDGKCVDEDKVVIQNSKFMSFEAILKSQGVNTNPNTGSSNTNTNPTGNSNNTNPGGSSSGSTGANGCDSGFHKVGPLCVPDSPFNNGNSLTKETTFGGVATRVIQILLYFAAIVAVIMAIVGGYQVMTAAGNETQAVNGRKTLINAIIGLVIVILSYMIIQAVISFVTKG